MATTSLRPVDAPAVETRATRLTDGTDGRERWQGAYRVRSRSWTNLSGFAPDPLTAHRAARYAGHKNGD